MKNFKNLEQQVWPFSALHEPQVQTLRTILSDVANCLGKKARGTFILDSQARGEDAQMVMRFDLAGGKFSQNVSGGYLSSAQLAENSIDEFLALPDTKRYHVNTAKVLAHAKTSMDVPTGLYRDNELKVLVLGTEHGRFLCSCHVSGANNVFYDASMALMRAAVWTLQTMTPNDHTLNICEKSLAHSISIGRADKNSKMVRNMVNAAFTSKKDYPAIARWREWASQPDNVGLQYFE